MCCTASCPNYCLHILLVSIVVFPVGEYSITYGIHMVLESKSLPKMPNFLIDMVMVCS